MRMAVLSLGFGGRTGTGREDAAEVERGREGAENTAEKRKRRGEVTGEKKRGGEVGEGAGPDPKGNREKTDCRGLLYDWWTIELYPTTSEL